MLEPDVPHPVPLTLAQGARLPWTTASSVAATRLMLQLWGRSAPHSAARFCHRLYFSTRRGPVPPLAGELWRRAKPLRLDWRSPARAAYPSRGVLRGWEWGEGRLVLLVHGWQGRAAQLAVPYVEPLLGAGFRVVAFDMPGHGESPGKHADFLSFQAALEGIVARVGEPFAIVAHSFAAPVVGQLLQAHACQRFVAVSPLVWLRSGPERFCSAFALPEPLREAFWRLLLLTHPEPEWDSLSLLGTRPHGAIASLLIQDRDDTETHWTGAVALARHWPDARLQLTRRLGHRRVLKDPAVIDLLLEFLREERTGEVSEPCPVL